MSTCPQEIRSNGTLEVWIEAGRGGIQGSLLDADMSVQKGFRPKGRRTGQEKRGWPEIASRLHNIQQRTLLSTSMLRRQILRLDGRQPRVQVLLLCYRPTCGSVTWARDFTSLQLSFPILKMGTGEREETPGTKACWHGIKETCVPILSLSHTYSL